MFFLKSERLFSFVYGGAPAWEQAYTQEVSEREGEICTVYRFEGGLKVSCTVKTYEDLGAYEWLCYYENEGKENTPLISDIWDADVRLALAARPIRAATPWRPQPKSDAFVLNPLGSTQGDETDFYTDFDIGGHSFRNYIFPQKPPKRYASIGGRSSDGDAPFFNLHQAGEGYILAYGWTGQWNAELSRAEDNALFKAGIEETSFVLYPGERIRTGSVLVLPYRGDPLAGQNLWRRLLATHLSPYRGEAQKPFSLSFWGGTETKDILARTDYALGERAIPFDMVWMDAGWCGPDTLPTKNEYEGDWWSRVGDWEVSPHIHPNGLYDVAAKIKEYGKKYILWFEPERTRATTHLAKEHPDFLIRDEAEDSQTLLVDLGNPEALAFVKQKIYGIIEALSLDWYRQDFNTRPLHIWRANDKKDRRGMTEIKHVMGLYDFWDEMRTRFPHVMIDNCASGGKRLDIETLKRSVPLWRSDAQCPADPTPEITQANQVNFSLWMPYSGTGTGRVYDTYAARSAYATGGVGTTYSYSSTEHFDEKPEYAAFLYARAEEYIRLRPYFDGDIYPLTRATGDESAWCAVEWHLPDADKGALQVFRRAHSPYETASFSLHGIKEGAVYRIEDMDGGAWCVSGGDLLLHGLTLTVKEKRTAKVYFYERIN